jgi:hypothetical protein
MAIDEEMLSVRISALHKSAIQNHRSNQLYKSQSRASSAGLCYAQHSVVRPIVRNLSGTQC